MTVVHLQTCRALNRWFCGEKNHHWTVDIKNVVWIPPSLPLALYMCDSFTFTSPSSLSFNYSPKASQSTTSGWGGERGNYPRLAPIWKLNNCAFKCKSPVFKKNPPSLWFIVPLTLCQPHKWPYSSRIHLLSLTIFCQRIFFLTT